MQAFFVVGIDSGNERLMLLRHDLPVEEVAAEVKTSPYSFRVLLAAVVTVGREDAVDEFAFGDGGRSRLEVVVHEVIASALSGISTVRGPPIIKHVVAQVGEFRFPPADGAAAVQAWGTAAMVCQQVVMETCPFAAPDGAVAVVTLDVYRLGEALAQDAPLHGEVLVAVEGGTFVRAPAHAAMVDDDVRGVASPHGVVFRFQFVSHAAADETDDDIGGALVFFLFLFISGDVQGVVFDADAIPRSSLSGDGEVAVLDYQPALQLDDSRYVEHDGAGAFHVDSGTQRAFAAVVKVGDVIYDSSASAADGVAGKSFGSGKSGCVLGLCKRGT